MRRRSVPLGYVKPNGWPAWVNAAPQNGTYLYRFFDSAGGLLYIGVTGQARIRVKSHWYDKPWRSEIATATYEPVVERHPLDKEARYTAELEAITLEQPRYNREGVTRPYTRGRR